MNAREALRRYGEPGLVAAALGAAYLIIQPDSADHAAQVFRSGLFTHEGIVTWDNFWFGGHHLPGYGILLPIFSALIGPRLVGVLASIAAALLFSGIAYRRFGDRARLGVIWFATATSISLFTGRLTFALGVAVALCAVHEAQRGHRALAILFAALTPLASPVAALFLACGVVAYAIAERSRKGIELGVVAVGVALLVNTAFPEGGTEPFDFSSFEPAILVAIAVFVALPPDERLLRYGVAVYGAALSAAFLIQTPMGGNATRMGSLLLGPVLAFGLWRRQRFALVLLMPGLDLLAVVACGAGPRGGERAAVGERGLLRAADRLPARSSSPGLPARRGAPRGASLGIGLRPARDLHRQGLGAPARPQAQSALLPIGPHHRAAVPELARRPRRRLRRGPAGSARLRGSG